LDSNQTFQQKPWQALFVGLVGLFLLGLGVIGARDGSNIIGLAMFFLGGFLLIFVILRYVHSVDLRGDELHLNYLLYQRRIPRAVIREIALETRRTQPDRKETPIVTVYLQGGAEYSLGSFGKDTEQVYRALKTWWIG
jgi:hypothetical protein